MGKVKRGMLRSLWLTLQKPKTQAPWLQATILGPCFWIGCGWNSHASYCGGEDCHGHGLAGGCTWYQQGFWRRLKAIRDGAEQTVAGDWRTK